MLFRNAVDMISTLYLPKKTDLSVHSQQDLNRVAIRLSQRPRKTLYFRTPVEKLWESVALNSDLRLFYFRQRGVA